ncbi:MAG: hypothetical protein ACPLXR_06650 [Halothiobacillaceae bacterium]
MSKDGKLGKEERERLETLEKGWDKVPDSFWGKKLTLTLPDLRLLLNHFQPLRQLIWEIARGADATAEATPRAEAGDTLRLEQALKDLEACTLTRKELQLRMQALQQQLNETKAALSTERARCTTLQHQLKAAQAEAAQQKQEAERWQKEAERAKRSAAAHPVLQAIAALPEVARRMELAALPEDPALALAHAAAVLAEQDNLLRLWDALADQASAQNPKLCASGQVLLQAALEWHNLNHQSRPARLDEPAPGAAFDYNRHNRAPATPTGEIIDTVWLPALLRGKETLKKALVTTR